MDHRSRVVSTDSYDEVPRVLMCMWLRGTYIEVADLNIEVFLAVVIVESDVLSSCHCCREI